MLGLAWHRFSSVRLALRALWLVMVASAVFAVGAAAIALALGEWEAAILSFFNGAIVLLALWWLPKRSVRRALRGGN